MKEIQKFVNEQLGCEIRVMDRDGEPWFVAKDVCAALGIKNITDATKRLDADERGSIKSNTSGGKQTVTIVSESGLCGMITQSQKPETQPFKRWIRKEVLPSIRKHGAYMTPQVAQQALDNPEIIRALAAQVLRDDQRIKHLEARDDVFGNRTPYGEISDETGRPKVKPVRGYLRSTAQGFEFVPDAIQLALF